MYYVIIQKVHPFQFKCNEQLKVYLTMTFIMLCVTITIVMRH
jgi:hypothetical protein